MDPKSGTLILTTTHLEFTGTYKEAGLVGEGYCDALNRNLPSDLPARSEAFPFKGLGV